MLLNLKLYKGEEIVLEKKDIFYKNENDIITFNLEDMEHTINLTTKEFTRENNEYSFFMDIAEKKCEITLKKEQYYLQVEVEYANLLRNKNLINLSYLIETDDEKTELILELEGEE